MRTAEDVRAALARLSGTSRRSRGPIPVRPDEWMDFQDEPQRFGFDPRTAHRGSY